ncbi:hypothetical protein [Xenorhabdus hominickii]|uniref:Uncharacterized protein n=1 Tax=Xenorhabdus hominickii TaxID=351679 RepID=A0A1V0M4J2_XENHO|nr:hypothetical protein [Xenorhabdus hominickii]ARD69795.1 hypothetical protein [Xenorhabdus hominickii]PHM51929.1 hypothetical protein Xhom_04768 [Xenorhabdus hominickii]
MEDRLKFKAFIQRNHPEFIDFWDWKESHLFEGEVENRMGLLSTGEQHMLRFYLGIWNNDNRYNFDFIQAMNCLDERNLSIIREWVNNPIWS